MNDIREQLKEAEQLIIEIKKDLFEAIEILSKCYFTGMPEGKRHRIHAIRSAWLHDKKRDFLLFPGYILIKAATALVDGSTVTGIKPGGRIVKNAFYRECNSQVMNIIDDLIKREDIYELMRWRKTVKDLGLLLTVDKMDLIIRI